MHYVRIQVDGVWAGAYTPIQSDYGGFETRAAGAVNGDFGGTWAPTSAITVAGSGILLTGPLVVFGAAGQLRTQGASRFKLTSFPLLGLAQGVADQYAALGSTGLTAVPHAGATRLLTTPCVLGTVFPRYAGTVDLASAGIRMTASRVAFAGSFGLVTKVFPATLNVPLRVHDGATFSSVAISFKIGFDHVLTGTAPRARVVRVGTDGTRVPITLQAAGADALGYVTYALPSTAASWFDAGKVKTFTLTIDTAQVILANSYTYFVEIVEEDNGALYPSQFSYRSTVVAASTGADVALVGAVTLDGIVVAAGKRVLLKDQTDSSQNGIWVTSAGPWARSNDMITGGIRGAAVLVQSGAVNGGFIYQLVTDGPVTPTIVNAASTANINLGVGGPQTIDTIALIAGNTCLAKDQTVANENGIYTVNAGAWTRVGNVASTYVTPSSGNANWRTTWLLFGSTVTPAVLPAVTFVLGVVPYGNTWLAAVSTFSNITTMQFQ